MAAHGSVPAPRHDAQGLQRWREARRDCHWPARAQRHGHRAERLDHRERQPRPLHALQQVEPHPRRRLLRDAPGRARQGPAGRQHPRLRPADVLVADEHGQLQRRAGVGREPEVGAAQRPAPLHELRQGHALLRHAAGGGRRGAGGHGAVPAEVPQRHDARSLQPQGWPALHHRPARLADGGRARRRVQPGALHRRAGADAAGAARLEGRRAHHLHHTA